MLVIAQAMTEVGKLWRINIYYDNNHDYIGIKFDMQTIR